jgi:hypothetical protein
LRIRPIVDPRLYPLVIGERVRDKIAKTQPDVRPMSWPPSAKVRARLIVIELASEMLLRSQRKLHHAFQELVRRQADDFTGDLGNVIEATGANAAGRSVARGGREPGASYWSKYFRISLGSFVADKASIRRILAF